MESTNLSDDSLSISDKKMEGPMVDDGTYEAVYIGMQVGMAESQWGPKKYARLSFEISRGKFKGKKLSFRNNFMQDRDTGAWFVGSKSKLADVIRNITNGKNLDKTHVGKPVFITVKNEASKKDATKVYSNIVAVIPKPTDDDAPVAAPTAAAPAAAKPVAKPAAKPEGLLDDLTELSDFKD